MAKTCPAVRPRPVYASPLPAASPGAAPGAAPAIVLWGRLCATEKRIRTEIAHLPVAADDYHGTLHSLASAVQALEGDIRLLLKMLYDKGEF